MSNILGCGEKHLEGDYKRIIFAGEMRLKNSKTNALYAAGDIDIENTNIKKLYLAGDLAAKAVVIGKGKVTGDINFSGICKAEKLVVLGDLSAEYLECKCLRNGTSKSKSKNTLNWAGFVKAKTFESLMPLLLNFDYEFDTMLVSATLISTTEIACNSFYGFGKITAPCINAESIFLLTTKGTAVKEVVGSQITVATKFRPDKAFKAIPKTLKYSALDNDKALVSFDAISGDNIKLESVKANSVSGLEVVIGDLCVVDEVIYQDSIKISDKAVVGRVIKQ